MGGKGYACGNIHVCNWTLVITITTIALSILYHFWEFIFNKSVIPTYFYEFMQVHLLGTQ